MRERERDRQHDVARRALEDAVPVAEAALAGAEHDDVAGAAVERPHPADRLGHLLAVGADVLDRCGTDPAGDAGQRLDAGQVLLDGQRDQMVPVDAGLDLQGVLGPDGDGDPAGGDLQDGAGEARVAHHQVAAAAQHQQRLPPTVGVPDDVDDLGVGLRGHQPPGRAAQPQGGEVREGDVVLLPHARRA